MSYDAQLNRMVENGILSQQQAEQLQTTLGKPASPPPQRPSGRPLLLISVLLIIAFVLFSVFFLSGNAADTSQTTVEDIRQTLNQTGDLGAMNSITSAIIAISLFFILPLLLFVYSYNSIVAKEEQVRQSWAQVESNYQRRADLIPNLVDTVSRYLQHESDTLVGVTDARRHDFEAIVDALIKAQTKGAELLAESAEKATTDEAFLAELETSQKLIGTHMSRLIATVEAYPDLRASEQMMQLQSQLEGTENRINIARIRFNDSVNRFNKSIRVLPGSMVAAIGNFKRKAYFQSQTGADISPSVNFSSDNN